jgi:hypothetical protein
MSELRTASPSSTVIIVGVDTHKFVHVAVAIDHLGTRLANCSVSVDRAGYAELLAWARALGRIEAFGIEGTGSYGVGLASYLRRQALRVVEVSHCDRRKRRNNGKSDTLDAESAARSVLAGLATAVPKSADGAAEMVRQIKVARDTAVKAKSAAIIALKTLLVNAPCELRESLQPLTDRKLIDRCARLLPGVLDDTTASTKHALRALATRWLSLAGEIDTHDEGSRPDSSPGVWHRIGLGSGDDDRGGGQSHARPIGGRVRQTLRRVPDSGVERRHASPSTLSRRPSPSQRSALPDRHRAHAVASAHDGLCRTPNGSGSQ